MRYFGTDWGENEFEALNSFYIILFIVLLFVYGNVTFLLKSKLRKLFLNIFGD